MFNQEQKERYINAKEETTIVANNYLKRLFNYMEKYEEEKQKDLSQFTAFEIMECYKLFNLRSFDALNVRNSAYSLYTQWCLEQNLVPDGQNHYLEVSMDAIHSCLNKMAMDNSIISREELISLSRILPNARDKFVILYFFEVGRNKDYSDLTNLRMEDFDIENQTVTLSDRTVFVSRELINLAEESIVEDQYIPLKFGSSRILPYIPSDTVVRFVPPARQFSEFSKGRKIYHLMVRVLDYIGIGKWHTINTIIESGKIHMVNTKAKERGITGEEYINQYLFEVEHQYGCNIIPSIFKRKYQDYLIK